MKKILFLTYLALSPIAYSVNLTEESFYLPRFKAFCFTRKEEASEVERGLLNDYLTSGERIKRGLKIPQRKEFVEFLKKYTDEQLENFTNNTSMGPGGWFETLKEEKLRETKMINSKSVIFTYDPCRPLTPRKTVLTLLTDPLNYALWKGQLYKLTSYE